MAKTVGIYTICCAIDNKTYVGQSTNVEGRWRQHRHRLNRGEHLNRHLQAAWDKHGEDAFAFALVCTCSKERLGDEEVRVLSEVPEALRFNLGPAGPSPTLGLVRQYETNLKQSRSRGGRPFFSENLETGVVTRYEFTGEAIGVGFNRSKVLLCLYGKRETHKGHRFFYDPESMAQPKPKTKRKPREKRNRAVIGTCLATGEEKNYNYVALTEKDGFHRTGVTKVLSGLMHQTSGWTWRYADGLPHNPMSEDFREAIREGYRKKKERSHERSPSTQLPKTPS